MESESPNKDRLSQYCNNIEESMPDILATTPAGRKKKNRLTNLKSRKIKSQSDHSEMDGGDILSTALTIEELGDTITFSRDDDPDNSGGETPTRRKKKGLKNLSKTKNRFGGSQTSLRNLESADLKSLDENTRLDGSEITEKSTELSVKAGDARESDDEVANILESKLNTTFTLSDKSKPSSDVQTFQSEALIKPEPRTNLHSKPKPLPRKPQISKTPQSKPSMLVVDSAEENEDQYQIQNEYQKILDTNDLKQDSAQPSPRSKFTKPGVITPKPSMKDPVKRSMNRSLSKSNPDVSSSVRSSRRNWNSVKSLLPVIPNILSESSVAFSGSQPTLPRASSVMSEDSMCSQTSALPSIRTSTARHVNFLAGQKASKFSMMGTDELNRIFPDRHLRLFFGTWNMAEQKTAPEKLDDFLMPSDVLYLPDVLVITVQENSIDRKDWEVALQESIGVNHVLCHSALHGSLHIAVFMKRELIWYSSIFEDGHVTTRAFKQIKTKGAVAVSLTLFGTSFLLVGSHFKANEGNEKARIQDYESIIQQIRLPKAVVDNPLQAVDHDATARFDCVFWGGDMNFRITKDREQVLKMLEAQKNGQHPNFELLLGNEELTQAMNRGDIFEHFQEGLIKFPPTYKFDIGTDNYDTSVKVRIPSYTDRIVFRSKKKGEVICLKYNSCSSAITSDHKPVYGVYKVKLKPGRDTIPLSGGYFKREIYVEACKRRALRRMAANMVTKPPKRNKPPKAKSESQSSVCSLM